MDIGTCVVKYCLCFFNFVFVVFGTALLGFGIWLAADQSSVVTLLKFAEQETIKEYGSATVIEQLGYVLIAMGAFVFIISFLGYCGTIKESRFLLGAYAFFLTLILILEIVVVVLFAVYRTETELETRNLFTVSVQKFYTTRNKANVFTVTMNLAMVEGQCCGVSNYTDFNKATQFQANKTKNPEQKIPLACCVMKGNARDFEPQDTNCINDPTPVNSYQNNGCFDSLIRTLEDKMNITIIAGVIVGLLQIIGIIFAICVYKAAYYDYK